jgi:hypothetical protein
MVNISTTVRGHYDNEVYLWAIVIRRFCDTLFVWNLVLVHLETMLVSVQGWSMVCTEYTIGIEIVLDELDQTPR